MPTDLTRPPAANARARFPASFGPRALLTVDTEEEFDWDGPFTRDEHGLTHVPHLAEFQAFCEGLGVVPLYLVDWPVANSPEAREIIGEAARDGRAEVGIQLHPWVNPPHEEEVGARNSFAGNLPYELERAKLLKLRDQIEEGFGKAPIVYRAGRYGLGPRTAELLVEAGIAIDSSVRARFDYSAEHGPDYRSHPVEPYWADADRRLLELPLTTVWGGMLRHQGDWLYPRLTDRPRLRGALARSGMLERIALTPEGVSEEEAVRGIDMALDDGVKLLVLSFHSPSLAPGNTPYVRDEQDLEQLYDWLRAVYAHLERRGVQPTTAAQIVEAVER